MNAVIIPEVFKHLNAREQIKAEEQKRREAALIREESCLRVKNLQLKEQVDSLQFQVVVNRFVIAVLAAIVIHQAASVLLK